MSRRLYRRTFVAVAGAVLGAPFIRRTQAQTKTVFVNSYGGVWETSWRKAFFEPFTAQTGIQIKRRRGGHDRHVERAR
jgi:putative spermidine/putrescine transport system substrate-binding protein